MERQKSVSQALDEIALLEKNRKLFGMALDTVDLDHQCTTILGARDRDAISHAEASNSFPPSALEHPTYALVC